MLLLSPMLLACVQLPSLFAVSLHAAKRPVKAR
jgi:hypothetical protein